MIPIDQQLHTICAPHEVIGEILVGYGYVPIVDELACAIDFSVLAPTQPDTKIEVGRTGLVVDIRWCIPVEIQGCQDRFTQNILPVLYDPVIEIDESQGFL